MMLLMATLKAAAERSQIEGSPTRSDRQEIKSEDQIFPRWIYYGNDERHMMQKNCSLTLFLN